MSRARAAASKCGAEAAAPHKEESKAPGARATPSQGHRSACAAGCGREPARAHARATPWEAAADWGGSGEGTRVAPHSDVAPTDTLAIRIMRIQIAVEDMTRETGVQTAGLRPGQGEAYGYGHAHVHVHVGGFQDFRLRGKLWAPPVGHWRRCCPTNRQ
eukprot:scaffold549_cov385-Prasinococcus_capsulatus_cf.AAC.41